MNEEKVRALARQARDARRACERTANPELSRYYASEAARREKAAREEGAPDSLIENPEAPLPSLVACEKSRVAEEDAWARIIKSRDAALAKPATRSRGAVEKSSDAAEARRIAQLAKAGNKAEAAMAMRKFRQEVESR